METSENIIKCCTSVLPAIVAHKVQWEQLSLEEGGGVVQLRVQGYKPAVTSHSQPSLPGTERHQLNSTSSATVAGTASTASIQAFTLLSQICSKST